MAPLNARRSNLPDLDNVQSPSHPSLVLSRYLALADDNGSKDRLLDAAVRALPFCRSIYQAGYDRWKATLPAVRAETILEVQGRMIIGLGAENVLETGITLHQTYGVPFIPGSALKGLAAHYAHSVWGSEEEERKPFLNRGENRRQNVKGFQGDYHKILFGDQTQAGYITFHDAWITPETLGRSLCRDVMTVHHPKYYQADAQDNESAPTDFDSPIPIPFLSVKGSFHVTVSCDVNDENGRNWAKLAVELLKEALAEWGIGGKTNSGYGRLVESRKDSSIHSTTESRSNQIENGAIVYVKLCEKTPNGAWKAEDPSGGKPILVTANPIPQDWSPGVSIEVRVAINADQSMTYKYPSQPPERMAGGQGRQRNRPGQGQRKGPRTR